MCNSSDYSFVQWGLFDRQFGRSDADQPDPEGRVPQWEKASVQEMKDKYKSVGLGPRQVKFTFLFLLGLAATYTS